MAEHNMHDCGMVYSLRALREIAAAYSSIAIGTADGVIVGPSTATTQRDVIRQSSTIAALLTPLVCNHVAAALETAGVCRKAAIDSAVDRFTLSERAVETHLSITRPSE
jgi:hypothetical protein